MQLEITQKKQLFAGFNGCSFWNDIWYVISCFRPIFIFELELTCHQILTPVLFLILYFCAGYI